jgi:hypothetical protein
MDVQTASPAPSTPPALPPPAPAQIEPAPAVHTPPAVPAHAVQAAPPPPTASHTPLRPASSALAQPAQAVVPSVKTAVPSPSAPIASHSPGPAAPSQPVATVPQAALATPSAPAGSIAADEEPSDESAPAGEGRFLSDDLPEQVALEKGIVTLWQECKEKTAIFGRNVGDVKRSKEEVARLQAELDRMLHEYKEQLAKSGRNGRWTPFLRSLHLARATADRWAKRHELRVSPKPLIGPGEALYVPTEKDVTALVKKVAPGLIRRLNTPDSIAQFLTELAAALQPSSSDL